MRRWVYLAAVVAAMAGSAPAPARAAPAIPTPAHIVVVVEENHSSAGVIGNKSAPFMNQLVANGALMTQSYAETHPSEPNYLALFSGSTFGLTSDACPVNGGAAPNLGAELLAAGYTFAGFSEDLPAVGSPVCAAGKYARKHVPWANFTNVPPETSVPFTDLTTGVAAASSISAMPTDVPLEATMAWMAMVKVSIERGVARTGARVATMLAIAIDPVSGEAASVIATLCLASTVTVPKTMTTVTAMAGHSTR